MQILKYTFILIGLLMTLPLKGQFNSRPTFGKNRLQYTKKEWRYVESQNFIFYYYDAGYEIARFSADYAEAHIERICNTIGYFPFKKITILIYANTNDLQQSNIGINYQDFDRKGQTNFVRSEIEISYTGHRESFENKLTKSITDKLIFSMIYGESFKDALKNALIISLQPWFLSGAVKYISEGWTLEMDDYLRYALDKNYFQNLHHLENRDAELIGQAIWNYIGIKYGEDKISNILNLTRITKDERKSLSLQLRIKYKKLIQEIENFYRKSYNMVNKQYIFPSKKQQLFKSFGKVHYSDLSISPDGKYLAVAQNRKGALKVKLYNIEKKKKKTVIRSSYQVVNQEINNTMPLIFWRETEKLGVFTLHKERNYFYSINVKRNKKDDRYFRLLSNIENFEIHPNGNEFVISGEINSKSNIYQYLYKDRKLYKLTNDDFDDIDPIFLNNEKNQIVFSSNRPIKTKDSIYQKYPELFKNIYNLFIFTPDITQKRPGQGKVEILTRFLNVNIQPKRLNEKEILYLSDQTGIMNLYKYNFEDSSIIQLTHYKESIKTYAVLKNSLYLVFTIGNKDHIYVIENFNFSDNIFTPQTKRQDLSNLSVLKKVKAIREKGHEAKKILNTKTKKINKTSNKNPTPQIPLQDLDYYEVIPNDSLITEIDPNNYIFNYLPPNVLKQVDNLKENRVYRYDYFSKSGRQAFLERLKASKNIKPKLKSPKPNIRGVIPLNESSLEGKTISSSKLYEPEFALDRITISPFSDPIRGFSILTELYTTDIFENHKINFKYFGLTNLRNSNLALEYLYLKKHIDFAIRYEQQNIRNNNSTLQNSDLSQIYGNKLEFGFSYPYSIAGSFNFNPFFMITNSTQNTGQGASIISEQVKTSYAGYRFEYLYDNALTFNANTLEGFKLKFTYEHYYTLGNENINLGNLDLDGRYYYRINHNITLASRITAGRYIGNTNHKYLLGGERNELFRSADTSDPNNPISNIRGGQLLFTNFVNNLRGYNPAEIFGRNYLLTNIELRIPIISYLYRSHISSRFFREFQLVGFLDAGTVWDTGLFFSSQSLITETNVSSGGFDIDVFTYRDPILISYGMGLRTYLLGYYIKLDLAWRPQNQSRDDGENYQVHFSLGYDF